jgi:AraC-like DNA-binding protein
VPAAMMHLLEVTGINTLKQVVFHIGHHRHIIRRYEQVHHRLNTGPHSQLPSCLLAMQQLMIDLHQLATQTDHVQQDWLDKARQLLSEHLDKRLKTQQVAKTLNVSYASFRKRFTQATGSSPGQFRIRQRIQLAQEQLAGTQFPIADIAQNLGYPDVYSFSAQFARHTGTPPGQYRRQWQWDDAMA